MIRLRRQLPLLAVAIFWLLSVVPVPVPALASLESWPEGQEVFEGEVGRDAPTLAPKAGLSVEARAAEGPAMGVKANRIAGQEGENFLARTYGGGSQVTRQTSLGRRVIDNLANGVARESKVGRTALTSRVRSQIAKDAELLASPRSGVTGVEWHFFPSRTGAGPTAALQRALEEAGIAIVIH
jgi:hypothetical protein